MGVRFIGRYRPQGRLKITRSAVAPIFTSLPSITYSTLYVGDTYTAVDGGVLPLNAIVTRRWLLDGVQIGTGSTIVPVASGSLVLEVTASNSVGSVVETTSPLTITYRAPSFSVLPSISPNGGPMGTTFTGNDGSFANGSVSARAWLFNGTSVNGATTASYTSDGIGSLVYRVTLSGPGGSLVRDSTAITVTSVPAKLNPPSWAIATGNLGTFAEGTSVSIPLLVTDPENNVATYEVIGGTLPDGTSLNMFSGVISGTLAEVVQDTVYTFSIKVTDRTNLTLTGTFSINVANVKTTVTWETDNSQPLADIAPGVPVNVSLGASSN